MTESPQGTGTSEYVRYPTFARAALRPRWLALLAFALAVAAGFEWLGQWQLGRAVETATVVERDTETVRPLEEVLAFGDPMTDAAVDSMVTVTGSFRPGDWLIVGDRDNEGETGYWVVGLLVADSGSVAVAVGWTADEAGAQQVADRLNAETDSGPVVVTGRLTAGEAVDVDTDTPSADAIDRMSIPWLANMWSEVTEPVSLGYIVSHDDPPSGLVAIPSPKPEATAELNWLNLFYAIEWVVFSGFAVFLWWRLVADDVRREREDLGFIDIDDELDDDAAPSNDAS